MKEIVKKLESIHYFDCFPEQIKNEYIQYINENEFDDERALVVYTNENYDEDNANERGCVLDQIKKMTFGALNITDFEFVYEDKEEYEDIYWVYYVNGEEKKFPFNVDGCEMSSSDYWEFENVLLK